MVHESPPYPKNSPFCQATEASCYFGAFSLQYRTVSATPHFIPPEVRWRTHPPSLGWNCVPASNPLSNLPHCLANIIPPAVAIWLAQAVSTAETLVSCLCVFIINFMIASARWVSPTLTSVEEMFLFSKKSYQLYADIGGISAYMWRRRVLINTGEDPNCIDQAEIQPILEVYLIYLLRCAWTAQGMTIVVQHH